MQNCHEFILNIEKPKKKKKKIYSGCVAILKKYPLAVLYLNNLLFTNGTQLFLEKKSYLCYVVIVFKV